MDWYMHFLNKIFICCFIFHSHLFNNSHRPLRCCVDLWWWSQGTILTCCPIRFCHISYNMWRDCRFFYVCSAGILGQFWCKCTELHHVLFKQQEFMQLKQESIHVQSEMKYHTNGLAQDCCNSSAFAHCGLMLNHHNKISEYRRKWKLKTKKNSCELWNDITFNWT